jgi:flagellar hook-length control protein FliK
VAKVTTTGVVDAGKLQGSGKGVSGSDLGFGAILAAEEAPAVISQAGVTAENSEEKVPETPVDSAQAAIVLIAIPQLTPMLPVLPVATQPASASPIAGLVGQPDTLSLAEALPTPAAQSLEDGALLSTPTSPPSTSSFFETKEAMRQPVRAMVLGTSRDSATARPLGDAMTLPLETQASKVAKTSAPTAEVKPAGSPVDAGKELDTKFFAAMEAIKSLQFSKEMQPTVQSPIVLATSLTEQSKADKADAKLEAMPSTYAANAPTLGTTSYASTAVADATQVSPEMQVAEQVTYWISQDVQNAELTLDGLGTDPVEVSIRMSGNEAQVSFRTDELQTRDLLEGAASHLKELLQNQGLVLSGVSVGASGSGDAGAGHQRPHHGARQTIAMPVEAEASLPRRLSYGAQGRSLDLFV